MDKVSLGGNSVASFTVYNYTPICINKHSKHKIKIPEKSILCKLRSGSLIVEAKIFKDIPNLEFKIVSGMKLVEFLD